MQTSFEVSVHARGVKFYYQSIFLKKLSGFELAVVVQQCDGLLMNESAENGGTRKRGRKIEHRGAENGAGMACVFASLMSNFFLCVRKTVNTLF